MRKLILISLTCLLVACQSAYYSAWEKVGVEKRDILVDRVVDAKESQEEAQQQFKSALDQFSQLINFDGGELQVVYDQLKDQYEASDESASRVSSRIAKLKMLPRHYLMNGSSNWKNIRMKHCAVTVRKSSRAPKADITVC